MLPILWKNITRNNTRKPSNLKPGIIARFFLFTGIFSGDPITPAYGQNTRPYGLHVHPVVLRPCSCRYTPGRISPGIAADTLTCRYYTRLHARDHLQRYTSCNPLHARNTRLHAAQGTGSHTLNYLHQA